MVLHGDERDDRREVYAEGQVALPELLTARGWRLIVRAPDRLFAVSEAWGCTGTKATIKDVIEEAWGIGSFCEYVNRKKAEDDAVSRSSEPLPNDGG